MEDRTSQAGPIREDLSPEQLQAFRSQLYTKALAKLSAPHPNFAAGSDDNISRRLRPSPYDQLDYASEFERELISEVVLKSRGNAEDYVEIYEQDFILNLRYANYEGEEYGQLPTERAAYVRERLYEEAFAKLKAPEREPEGHSLLSAEFSDQDDPDSPVRIAIIYDALDSMTERLTKRMFAAVLHSRAAAKLYIELHEKRIQEDSQ